MEWRYNTIWFKQIEANKQLTLDCKSNLLNQ